MKECDIYKANFIGQSAEFQCNTGTLKKDHCSVLIAHIKILSHMKKNTETHIHMLLSYAAVILNSLCRIKQWSESYRVGWKSQTTADVDWETTKRMLTM